MLDSFSCRQEMLSGMVWTQPQTGFYVNAIGIKIPSFKNIFRGKSFYRKMNKEKFHRNLIFVILFQLIMASSWRTASDLLFAGWASPASKKGYDVMGSLYVSRKLPNYPSPKPTFCPKWEVSVNVGLGEGYVGSSPETYKMIQEDDDIKMMVIVKMMMMMILVMITINIILLALSSGSKYPGYHHHHSDGNEEITD